MSISAPTHYDDTTVFRVNSPLARFIGAFCERGWAQFCRSECHSSVWRGFPSGRGNGRGRRRGPTTGLMWPGSMSCCVFVYRTRWRQRRRGGCITPHPAAPRRCALFVFHFDLSVSLHLCFDPVITKQSRDVAAANHGIYSYFSSASVFTFAVLFG